MRDIRFEKGLFENWMTGKIMDELLCSYKGLPKGVNYMVIGDPGVVKTTIILDLLSEALSVSKSPLKKYAFTYAYVFVQLPEFPAVIRISHMT